MRATIAERQDKRREAIARAEADVAMIKAFDWVRAECAALADRTHEDAPWTRNAKRDFAEGRREMLRQAAELLYGQAKIIDGTLPATPSELRRRRLAAGPPPARP